MKQGLYTLAIFVTGILLSSSALADVKIKSRQTMSGQTYENTIYIKGKRQRNEAMNGMMINLTQCDLRRGVQLNSQTKTYIVSSYSENAQQATKSTAAAEANGVVHAGGRVTTTVTIKDTRERKQMFGFTARRLIITMQTVSSPDACSKTDTKLQTDGWYVDAEFALDCDLGHQNYNSHSGRNGGCRDKYEMKTVGTGKRGYPLYEKMTMFDESGKETYTMTTEVVELSKATLDASLFEVPADYREVQNASEMYSVASMGASQKSTSVPRTSSEMTFSSFTDVAGASSTGDASAIPGKKAGVIRIGLAGVKTGQVGDGIAAADLAAVIESTLVGYLKMPNVEVISLEAKLSTATLAEARARECDYVVHASVSHKKGGGGFGGMFSQALGSTIGRTGIGHTGSTAGNIAGQVATNTIVNAASISASVKNKDEITLDLKVNNLDGASALARVYKAKAKSNADDIISQVVEQAAQEIVGVIQR